MINKTRICRGVKEILLGLGCDLNDPNFIDTPSRVANAYTEIFKGVDNAEDEVEEILKKTFPCSHQQMVLAQHIEAFSVCPHHLLPVHYDVTVAYMPTDKVIGISKLCRITQLLAARPVLQEQMVNDITRYLLRIPGCLGAGCVASGEHYCMRMRGVKQSHSVVVTSSLEGIFNTEPCVRSEFLSLR